MSTDRFAYVQCAECSHVFEISANERGLWADGSEPITLDTLPGDPPQDPEVVIFLVDHVDNAGHECDAALYIARTDLP